MRQGQYWWRVMVVALLAVVGWTTAVWAATVKQVLVENKNPAGGSVSTELVSGCVSLHPGGPFDAKTLSEDIKRLYGTGYFTDVEAQVESASGDQVNVTFKVAPKPRVRRVLIEGNANIKTSKITDKLSVQAESLVNDKKVADDVAAIRKLYEDKGYFQSLVRSELRVVDGGREADVVYVIQEEPRLKVRDIQVVGNKAFTRDQILDKMQIKFAWWRSLFGMTYLNEEMLSQDRDAVTLMYTAKGYLDFRIDKVDQVPTADKKKVTLILHVTEGQPYTVATVDVEGCKRFGRDELLKEVKLAKGQVFDSDAEHADINRMEAKYDILGYVDLRIFPRLRQDAPTHTVEVVYVVDEGLPAKLRDIYINGNQVTKDKVIRRELAVLPGDLADNSKIKASKSRLMSLNYFESVDVLPTATERDDEKDLQVNVKEKRTGQLMLGVGYSSDDSVVGMAEITQSNFDLANWPSFTGGGQRMRLALQGGAQTQNADLSFTEPWFLDRPLRLDWDLYYRERDQDYYTQQNVGTSIGLTKPITTFWRHSIGYRVEEVKLSSFDTDVSQWVKDEAGTYTVSGVYYRIQRDTRDNAMNPTSGSRVAFTAEADPEFLGSYSDIYHLNLEGAKYFPVYNKCVIKLEAQMGTVDNWSGEEPVLFDRLYAGGDNSIRGFKRRAVSPVDDYDNSVGGESLARGTVEFLYPIYDMVRGSIFSDFGNVWADPYDYTTEMNVTVGPGILLDLPIGPIRLYYGFPVVTQQNNLGNGRFSFSMGYFF